MAAPHAHAPALLAVLRERFEAHMHRHPGVSWPEVEARLAETPSLLRTLSEMERTDGEPDVVVFDKAQGAFFFCDCAPESPAGRRSLCYDEAALKSRKASKPAGSALGMATAMGAALLTEAEYRHLQTLGIFDLKTSSWIDTPPAIRQLGGALFCDRRYNTVFTYHNGAESYYSTRGFRVKV